MKEYRIFGKNNKPVTINDMPETNQSIGKVFVERPNEGENKNTKKYGVNGETFYIFYRDGGSRIILPREHEDSIKERLEVLVGLNFEEVKCQ